MNDKEIYSIVDPKEALNRGNLFDYYFWPYKYIANIRPKNEKEDLMMKVQMYSFAAHELNLYLDVYPYDKQAIGLYNQYKQMCEEYTKEYEKKYGCIILDSNEKDPWKWIESPWPWERM
ncbi:MAG: spore coat protein CotJB [Bacilli bacterium]|nr:spore coat protein CotJB [Bacilli bacterium]